MIEIVFGNSVCGSLKAAQRFGVGKYQGGCIGVIISHADGSSPTKEEIESAQLSKKTGISFINKRRKTIQRQNHMTVLVLTQTMQS